MGNAEHERLLVLDDDVNVGRTVGLIGEATGMRVEVVTGPEAFFEALDDLDPTHIVLDLVMPEMDGVEVMRHLAERACDAAIIVSSGVGDRVLDAARRSAKEHGLNLAGVLPKPFVPQELRDLLKAHGPQRGRWPGAGDDGANFVVTPAALQAAIAGSQFTLDYQPKIVCANGALAGFEALVRWQHPEAGTIMPDAFIDIAEKHGLMGDLTEQVFAVAVAALAEAPGLRDAPSLSVNLSARMLSRFDLADYIASVCRDAGIDPVRLTLELTETAAMDDAVLALDLLTRLRMKGFRLAMDDFGTGYSSMVQLARLPFSEIKVDKSFTMTASSSAESRTIIRSVVDLGHNLGLQVVAEGVEDAGALAFLKELGCDFAQGYYIGRPMPAADIPGWIAGRENSVEDA